MPLVSVIMNCYNGSSYLGKAIDSVYAQKFLDWEIIFWDNASTDESGTIAKSYDKRLKYFRTEKNTPLGEARNSALSKVSGKYIGFLDCDDVYLPNKLLRQIELLENTDYAMVYSGAMIIDQKDSLIGIKIPKNVSGYIFPNLLVDYEINMQSVMLRKSKLDELNYNFDTSLKFCPDYNLFMHIAAEFNVGIIKDALVKYRILPNSLSNQTVDLAGNEINRSLDQVFDRFPGLKLKYVDEAKAAYAKVHFYNAISFIHKSNYHNARSELRKIIFERWEYFTLYFILFFLIPKTVVLKLLGR